MQRANTYKNEFVRMDELNEILINGLHINDYILKVTCRCFICDSPARAFIKDIRPIYTFSKQSLNLNL